MARLLATVTIHDADNCERQLDVMLQPDGSISAILDDKPYPMSPAEQAWWLALGKRVIAEDTCCNYCGAPGCQAHDERDYPYEVER